MKNLKSMLERIKDLVLKPQVTWTEINNEEMTVSSLFKEYLLILAAVPAIAQLLGRWIVGIPIPFGVGFVKLSFFASLVNALVSYVLTVAAIWAFAKVLQFDARVLFASADEEVKAFKISVFSAAPYLVAGIVYLIPSLGVIVILVGLYCLYLIYAGLPLVMETPKEKVLPYMIVIIITIVVLAIIIGTISSLILNAFGPDINLRGV